MELGIFQKQTLKLMMTTELRQAIELLQYSTLELNTFIKEQALENPLIEIQESTWDSNIPYRPSTSSSNYDPVEQATEKNVSFYEYLFEQVRFIKVDSFQRKVIEHLINLLDHNGYLLESVHDIANRLSISNQSVEEALTIIQQFEPAGVGARNLEECLWLQLQRLNSHSEIAETIIKQHLEKLANRKWKEIAQTLTIPLRDVQAVYDLIQTFNPRPCSHLSASMPQYIKPDLIVKKEKGYFSVAIDDQHMTQFTLNSSYVPILTSNEHTEASKYLQGKYQQYSWLLKSIEQRKQTMINVMKTIVEKQIEFFEHGSQHLSPLTLKDVSEQIEVHESTVSRTVNGKYVQTPHGLFELKYFFKSGLRTEIGEDASSETVKQHLRSLIDDENKKKPLSDQKISIMLKNEFGLVVSRRTIAKYREQMNIPSSSKRKRFDD